MKAFGFSGPSGFCQIHSTKWEMGFLTIHFLNRIYHYWIFHGNLGVPPANLLIRLAIGGKRGIGG